MNQVTSKTYDSHILSQGLQFQIDNYYQPKDAILKRRISIIIDAIDPQPGETILDIGCGVGTFAFHCAQKKAITYGLDYSPASLSAAKSLCAKFEQKDARFVLGCAKALPFKTGYFDKVVAADFIEHITWEDKVELFKEIYRVIKKNGLLVIFTPNNLREKIGDAYWRLKKILFKQTVPSTELHFGLINRFELEPLLESSGFKQTLKFEDVNRPYLAKLPFLNNLLALELLWKAIKK